MRLSTEQLQQHLARELKPLYAVFGDETLLGLEASDRIRARARADGYTERDDVNWHKHTLCWVDETGATRIDYRPVHMYTLSSDVSVVPPKARVY